MIQVSVKRSLAAMTLAFAVTMVPVSAIAQSLGSPGVSDGEVFIKAIKDGDVNKALELANQPGARVASYRGYNGDTALHIVTRKRELDWVAFLLTRGADPNIGDANGDTPLIVALPAFKGLIVVQYDIAT